jgi:hypothetical protein
MRKNLEFENSLTLGFFSAGSWFLNEKGAYWDIANKFYET